MFKNCPIGCSAELVESDIALPEGPLLRCPACGQLLSRAGEDVYKTSMGRFEHASMLDMSARVHLKRLKRVMRYWTRSPKDTRLLDIGCSFGMFLDVARKAGFNASGVEPSANAARVCKEKGFGVECGYLENLTLPPDSYDVITMYEVIEHLTSPVGLLKEARRVLKPGGLMFVSTGNTASWTVGFLKDKWDYFAIGQGHISFFNPASLRKIAENAGFEVVGYETRRVAVFGKDNASPLKYRLGKLFAELLSLPAKLLGKGHDSLIVLKKP